MINLALINARIPSEKIFITPIPDLNNHKKWKEHIDFFVQDYDIVFTNDSETKHVFEKEGVKVSKIPFKNRINKTLELSRVIILCFLGKVEILQASSLLSSD